MRCLEGEFKGVREADCDECGMAGDVVTAGAFFKSRMARSAPLAHEAGLVALPVAILDRGALVMRLLALRQRKLDLRPPGRIEIDR